MEVIATLFITTPFLFPRGSSTAMHRPGQSAPGPPSPPSCAAKPSPKIPFGGCIRRGSNTRSHPFVTPKVEAAVGAIQTGILLALRHETLFSPVAMNGVTQATGGSALLLQPQVGTYVF